MKKWLISAAALALAVTLVGQQPLSHAQDGEPGITGEVTPQGYLVRDFAPNKPAGPSLIDDAIPRVFVRFDDGRANQYTYNQIQAFGRRSIDVTLVINANDIGGSGKLTWAQIRTLQEFFRSHGATLHFTQHGNTNFDPGDTGTPTPGTMTHNQFIDELNTDLIFRETGYRVRTLLLPGDGALVPQFHRRNRHYLSSLADSLGIWWTFATPDQDSTMIVDYSPNLVPLDAYGSAEASFRYFSSMRLAKPGMNIPRWEIPVEGASDLGRLVVERVASDLAENFELTTSMDLGDRNTRYGYEFETGVKPPRTNTWTLTGNGASPGASGIWAERMFAGMYSRALAGNYGFSVGIHDSAAAAGSLGTPPTGISTTEYNAGAFSPEHVAWTLAMLEAKGHIKCVGPEEYAEWVTGEWAPGTDLINNPSCLIPQFDIGDTLGAASEHPFIRGFSHIGRSTSTSDSTAFALATLTYNSAGNTAKWAQIGPKSPHARVGSVVTGVRGRAGGISIAAANGINRLKIAHGNLPPGRYEFSMAYNAGGNPQLREFHIGAKIKGYKPRASMAAGFATAFNDSAFSYMWRDSDQTVTMTNQTGRYGDFWIPLEFPAFFSGRTATSKLPVIGQSDQSVGATLMHPYGAGASEYLPMVSRTTWAFVLEMDPAAGSVISSPRLIYLGK